MADEFKGWQRLQLRKSGVEFVDGDRSSKYPKQSEFQTSGIPFLNTTSTSEFRLDLSQTNFVTPEKYKQITKGRAQRNDLLLTTRGSNTGKVALFNCEYDKALINAQMLILRTNPNHICPAFLFYQLRSADFQATLKAYSSGSAQPQLPIKSLKDVYVVLPPLDEQRAIAHILGTLDNKIELNRRMNETLEAIARALFKSWFVDFDPVRAKHALSNAEGAEGRDTGLPKPLANLFPDSFEDSEMGKIPKGWRLNRLGNETKTLLGGTPSRDELTYWGGSVPWINSGKANEFRIIEPSEFITQRGLESSATKLLPERTTVIAITGATLGQVSITEIATCANQSIVGVLGSDALPSEFIYFWVKENIDSLIASQTGGAQQHINKNNVNELPIICPSSLVVAAYVALVRSLFDRIKKSYFESRTLETLRDTLLPKLISGELRVKDAERFVLELSTSANGAQG